MVIYGPWVVFSNQCHITIRGYTGSRSAIHDWNLQDCYRLPMYCRPLWSPTAVSDILKLEKVQRAKLFTSKVDWSRDLPYILGETDVVVDKDATSLSAFKSSLIISHFS